MKMERDGGEDKDKKKKKVILFLLIMGACLAFVLINVFNRERPEPEPEIEPLSVFWEETGVSMNIGEIREIRWRSNRETMPQIFSEGAAAFLAGVEGNLVRLRAVESGVAVVTLEAEGMETVCIVTVVEETFMFMYEEAELRSGQDAVFEVIAEPAELMQAHFIRYSVWPPGVINLGLAADDWVQVEAANPGEALLTAEWRGKKTEMFVRVVFEPEREIIVPYRTHYMQTGGETIMMASLDVMLPGDGRDFRFVRETGKNNIAIEANGAELVVRALAGGTQWVRVSHPRASEPVTVTFDVLAPRPIDPPAISVNESPFRLRTDEERVMQMRIVNADASNNANFRYQIIENAYAVRIARPLTASGNLAIIGYAPGAAKIRITNPAVSRPYDVIVIVE